MACAAMALNRLGHGHPTTRAIAAASQANSGNYIPANSDRAGGQDITQNSTGLIAALALRRKAINPDDNPLATSSPGDMLSRLQTGSDPGTSGKNIANTLKLQYNVQTAQYKTITAGAVGPLKATMAGATVTHPVILGLVNPPHFVLCEGLVHGSSNRYNIVDPADGVRYTDGRLRSGPTLKFNGQAYNTAVDEVIVT